MAFSIIKNFLDKSGSDAKVVYVGMSQKGKELKEKIHSQNLLTIGVEDDLQAAYVLAPNLALRVAAEQKKCLLVFDDVLLHQMKERLVYDIAEQPFSPINIINEIASQTGTFKSGRQLTSILIADTNGNTLTFQRDEDLLMQHIESLADQQITFENETSLAKQKQVVPVLPVKPGQLYPNQALWVKPFLLPSIEKFQTLCSNLD